MSDNTNSMHLNDPNTTCYKCDEPVPLLYLHGENDPLDETWVCCAHTGWYCPSHSQTSNCGDMECVGCNPAWFFNKGEDSKEDKEDKEDEESESESEDEPEEISTCNCKPDWDIRCCCYPPMITRSFPATMTDGDIGWYKKDGHQDNWDNCPMKVGNAVWHYTNSRLSNDNRTKKGEYNLKYAKWVFGLMGLNQAQVKEAIDILKEQREED